MAHPRPLPAPPASLPRIDLLPWGDDLWRIQNAPARVARSYPEPRFRFDAPTGQFPTVYAAIRSAAA